MRFYQGKQTTPASQCSSSFYPTGDREMSEAFCYFSPRQARLIVALISFGGFFLWIVFGSYSFLPANHPEQQGLTHREGLAQRSVPLEAEWRHGRRLLSVNESAFNCSVVHLATEDGKKVKLDDNAVRALITPLIIPKFLVGMH